MIESLKIKNVALLRDVKIDFVNGFNVFLGETGAGKSIILDALNFVLGSKADKELITHGEDSMRVEAVFSDYSENVSKALLELGFEDEGLLVINRVYSLQGKSEIRINGNASTLSMLKEVTNYLVDSYSQHDNLLLLKQKNHISILDSYNKESLQKEKIELFELLKDLKEINQKVKTLGGSGAERERLLDLLKFQIEEITTLNPTVVKENQITEKFNLMKNAEKIALTLQEGLSILSENEISVLNLLRSAVRNLSSLDKFSNSFIPLNERLTSALYELEDIVAGFEDESEKIYFNEREFELLDSELDRYKSIKRKYGATVEDVLSFLEKTNKEFEEITNAEKNLAKLEKEKEQLTKRLVEVCNTLTDKRKAFAVEIEKKLISELAYLGMKNVKFVVDFKKTESFSENGNDDIEFLFSANAGVEVKPLSKIISGGEMSRFSLAMKNIIKDNQACLVFDEIDAGISGEVGLAVAERIANLSANNQVICISHSAQVCAMADNFFFVKKNVVSGLTSTQVKKLEENEIINQLAIMGSGKNLNEVSVAYSKQLLENARSFKQNLK